MSPSEASRGGVCFGGEINVEDCGDLSTGNNARNKTKHLYRGVVFL